MAEISVYGFITGILHEKLHLRLVWSLIGAMMAGRVALLLAVSVTYLLGEVYSPLGVEANPLAVLWSVIKLGYLGIIIQLVAIPLIMRLLERHIK